MDPSQYLVQSVDHLGRTVLTISPRVLSGAVLLGGARQPRQPPNNATRAADRAVRAVSRLDTSNHSQSSLGLLSVRLPCSKAFRRRLVPPPPRISTRGRRVGTLVNNLSRPQPAPPTTLLPPPTCPSRSSRPPAQRLGDPPQRPPPPVLPRPAPRSPPRRRHRVLHPLPHQPLALLQFSGREVTRPRRRWALHSPPRCEGVPEAAGRALRREPPGEGASEGDRRPEGAGGIEWVWASAAEARWEDPDRGGTATSDLSVDGGREAAVGGAQGEAEQDV